MHLKPCQACGGWPDPVDGPELALELGVAGSWQVAAAVLVASTRAACTSSAHSASACEAPSWTVAGAPFW